MATMDPYLNTVRDANEPMAASGMGAVHTRTSDGRPLRSSPDARERQRLLQACDFAHHDPGCSGQVTVKPA